MAVVGCDPPAAPGETAAAVAVQWNGAVQGSFSAPAEGRWCPSDSLLEVLALRADTGFAFTLLAPDTLKATSYPVLSATIAATWRPLAYAAIRFAADTAIKGFEATGGNVVVSSVDNGTISGTLQVGMRINAGFDTLRLSGTFTDVPISPAAGHCGRVHKPKSQ
jgi:hypothetical protein